MNVLTAEKKIRLLLPTGEELVRAGLLFLISRASLFGAYPFGMAFWAASIPEGGVYLGLLGMLLGVVSAGGEFLKYALSGGLYLLYTYFKKKESLDFLFCGLSVLVAGIVSILFNSQSPLFAAASVLEGVLSALTFILSVRASGFFKSCKGVSRATQEEIISVVLLCGILLTGFSGIYLSDKLHLCMMLGIYLILFLSKCTSVAAAGSIGLSLGFLCSMHSASAVVIMGICGISAVFSNILKEFGKTGNILGFFAGVSLCTIYTGNFYNPPVTIYEVALASLLFICTPKMVFAKADSIFSRVMQSQSRGKEIRIKEYLSAELMRISKAFGDLSKGFLSLSRPEERTMQATDMFDETASRVCKACAKWGDCWIDGFNEMYRQMYGILNVIETNGYCSVDNMPIVFKNRCIRPDVFMSEFNHLYEIYKQTAMWQGEVTFGQDMVARQYNEISNLIKGLSDEVETGFSFIEASELKLDNALEKTGIFAKEINVIENIRREPEVYITSTSGAEPEVLERIVSQVIGMPMRIQDDCSSMKFVVHNRYFAEYAVCQHSGESEQVCGDTVVQFETEDNKFCVLLCDGMGSGGGASEESKLTAELLQDFIKAGFIKDTAVKMINSTLAMKAGRESFSTIDLLEIDLRSGQAEFLKVGAAESYLKHKKEVEIVSTKAMPVGILGDIQVPAVTRTLCEGDVIIMASDGISETGYGALRGAWVKQLVLSHEGDMQELCDLILKNARQKAYPKSCDDMTVAAIRIKKV